MPKRQMNPPEVMDNLGREDVRDMLNALSVGEVIALLGSPSERVGYATAPGWTQGEGRPALANEDPAVMQSVGRCAAERARRRFPAPLPVLRAVHPSSCDWCEYPEDELLKACAWAVWHSRYVESHVFEWRGDGATYTRAGSMTGYQNPDWRRFFELPTKERERRIDAASGRTQAEIASLRALD